ncbi:pilin family protein [Francisella philomiragia]|uniref:pilin n=1 Tax=Francisella philomiragia TaxID=28110 RepID=UPI0005A5663B|nr:pilin [Francisella philomiragia]AJI55062.1 pilin family protein [Francisella philomiragia]MBK2252929.1 pilin [Francisella philomiragia]
MKYKKTIPFLALLMLAGCSGHDDGYYKDHIDEAQTKAKECNDALNSAFKFGNEDKYNKILKDPECVAANNVAKDYEEKKSKINQALISTGGVKAEVAEYAMENDYKLDIDTSKIAHPSNITVSNNGAITVKLDSSIAENGYITLTPTIYKDKGTMMWKCSASGVEKYYLPDACK